MSELVHVQTDGAVGIIRLDRPPVNAINAAMHGEIEAAAEEADGRADIRAVVVYGGQRAFAAGADIKEMAEMGPDEMAGYGGRLTRALDRVARIRKPVIAAVTGYALGGGCELALAADFRVVAEDAVIGLPEITLGIIPGAGGTQRLPRIVGPTIAKELIFSGRPVVGTRAVEIGLASTAVPADAVFDTSMELARRYAKGATAAIGVAKAAIDQGMEIDLAAALELESAGFAELFATEDQKIGMRSFIADGPGKAAFVGH